MKITAIVNLIVQREENSINHRDQRVKGRLSLSNIRYRKFGCVNLFFVTAILFGVICVTSCYEQTSKQSITDRAQGLNKVIMCPACPGESIDQSQNQLAVQMRQIVLDMLEQGATDVEVKQYFVERYDISVLLEPPRRGFALILWVVPPLVAIVALLTLLYTFSVMLKTRRSENGEATIPLFDLSQQERVKYIDKIDDLLKTDSDNGGLYEGLGKGSNNG